MQHRTCTKAKHEPGKLLFRPVFANHGSLAGILVDQTNEKLSTAIFKSIISIWKNCYTYGYRGYVGIRLCVNNYQKSDILRLLSITIAKTGLPRDKFCIILPPSLLTSKQASHSYFMHALYRLGFLIAIEQIRPLYLQGDLAAIKYPADLIIVDSSKLAGDNLAQLCPNQLKNWSQAATSLGMKVIFNQVESESQYNFLLKNNVSAFYSGSYFGCALTTDYVSAWLARATQLLK